MHCCTGECVSGRAAWLRRKGLHPKTLEELRAMTCEGHCIENGSSLHTPPSTAMLLMLMLVLVQNAIPRCHQ
jgi:hypothetical protein